MIDCNFSKISRWINILCGQDSNHLKLTLINIKEAQKKFLIVKKPTSKAHPLQNDTFLEGYDQQITEIIFAP